MKNREVWESYDFYTSEVTKHARHLGFAGIAICWLFRAPDFRFSSIILFALGSLIIFFLLDVSQYYVSAMRLRKWIHSEEEKRGTGSLEGEYWLPRNLDRPAFVLFHLKLAALLSGFFFIGYELIKRMD